MKLSGIDEKRIDKLATFFMACSKLEAMAIYAVNQACGNDIMPAVCWDNAMSNDGSSVRIIDQSHGD